MLGHGLPPTSKGAESKPDSNMGRGCANENQTETFRSCLCSFYLAAIAFNSA